MRFEAAGIDDLLSGAVEDDVFHGVSAVVVSGEGALYDGAHGEAGADTIFRNASMTKALTTAGALQLVERGLLDLDAPVESIVPEFGELQVLEGFDGDQPILRAPKTKATVRQLATHTSGCGYPFTSDGLLRYAELTGQPGLFSGLRASVTGPLARDPGTVWEYGTSTDWLGFVVEAASGQKLDAYLAEHLFGPLGMSDTTFAPDDGQRARLLALKRRTSDGALADDGRDFSPDPEWASGGAGSYGTASDYGRFIRAMLNGGEIEGTRVLGTATVEAAFADHLQGASLPEVIGAADSTLTNEVPLLTLPQGWGLGFHLVSVDIPGMRSAGTGDAAGLLNCYYWIDRRSGIGAALMTQVLPFFDAQIVDVLVAFETAVYEQARSG